MSIIVYLLSIVGQVFGDASDLGIPTGSANPGPGFLQDILNIVYAFAAFVAVVVVIIASITYSTSSGDPGKMAKARNAIIYSIAGFMVVVLAFAITIFVAKAAE